MVGTYTYYVPYGICYVTICITYVLMFHVLGNMYLCSIWEGIYPYVPYGRTYILIFHMVGTCTYVTYGMAYVPMFHMVGLMYLSSIWQAHACMFHMVWHIYSRSVVTANNLLMFHMAGHMKPTWEYCHMPHIPHTYDTTSVASWISTSSLAYIQQIEDKHEQLWS